MVPLKGLSTNQGKDRKSTRLNRKLLKFKQSVNKKIPPCDLVIPYLSCPKIPYLNCPMWVYKEGERRVGYGGQRETDVREKKSLRVC